MNLASALFYPIALLLPAAGAIDSAPSSDNAGGGVAVSVDEPQPAYVWPPVPAAVLAPDWPFAARMLEDADPEPAWQVHIEQHLEIRITPGGALPERPDMFVGMPNPDFRERFRERKIGNCLPIAGIAGVQPDQGNRLLLYMRDRRLVAADLERSCRARDFYLGFYMSRTPDGQLCVDRDTLLTRSGMNCKLTRIRQLVDGGR